MCMGASVAHIFAEQRLFTEACLCKSVGERGAIPALAFLLPRHAGACGGWHLAPYCRHLRSRSAPHAPRPARGELADSWPNTANGSTTLRRNVDEALNRALRKSRASRPSIATAGEDGTPVLAPARVRSTRAPVPELRRCSPDRRPAHLPVRASRGACQQGEGEGEQRRQAPPAMLRLPAS